MSEQRHVVKRQVVELSVRGSQSAQTLQAELSRVYRQRVVSVIDQCCTELSAHDRLYRIDSLVLDIGALDIQNLEADFVEKVETALRRELAAQIESQEQTSAEPDRKPQVRSQLELFALFVRTGSLPWWADASRPELLAENLQELLREAPGALRRLLQDAARQLHARRRLANQYTDEQLAELTGLLVPAHKAALSRDIQSLNGLVTHAESHAAHSAAWFRQRLWSIVLQVAGLGGGQYATLADFYQAVLKRMAAELGMAPGVLLRGMDQASRDRNVAVNRSLADMLARLTAINSTPSGDVQAALDARLMQLRSTVAFAGPLGALWLELRKLLLSLPRAWQADWLAALNTLEEATPGQVAARHFLDLLQLELMQPVASAEELSHLTQLLDAAISEMPQTDETGPMDAQNDSSSAESAPEDEASLDLQFSDADELYIGNAGLVILWPFLAHFFTHLGLLDEDQHFKEEAAQHRAAGLLQVVATGEASSPEYLLPLNKLLCGLEWDEVFEFDSPLLDSEAQECANLLEAAIAQAPILHDMSVAGFRNTFLLRQGVLGVRDGFRLLRVERETYDVVLERFPWNWEWVKLPWMESPLRVEW